MISVGSHLVSHLPVGKLIGEVLANWQVELQCERIPGILVFQYIFSLAYFFTCICDQPLFSMAALSYCYELNFFLFYLHLDVNMTPLLFLKYQTHFRLRHIT